MLAVGDFIAIATLAVQVINLCRQYVTSVRHAASEVKDYIARLERLAVVSESLEKLIESDPTILPTLQRLLPSLQSCRTGLLEVEQKLRDSEPSTGLVSFRDSRLRSLKWPFSKSAMGEKITNLDNNLKDLELPLQVDQLSVLLKTRVVIESNSASNIRIENKLDQSRQRELLRLLNHSGPAAFNAKERIHAPYCLPGTRVDLLRDIQSWSEDFTSKPIFWLSGMAGTGKSTISQELARSFHKQDRLAGSFFFRRGHPDLNRVDNVFTTLAYQMAQPQFPYLRELLCDIIERNESICEQLVTNQYDVLFAEPLRKIGPHLPISKPLMIVMDALDECEDLRGLSLLLRILQSTRDLETFKIKFFLTSRPEQVMNATMKNHDLHSFHLHNINKDRVTADIFSYLSEEFANIRQKHNLEDYWPSEQTIQNLATKADGLFIYAATVSRFLYDCPRRKRVKDLLLKFTEENVVDAVSTKYLDAMYMLVLEQCDQKQAHFVSHDDTADLRNILTCVVTLFDPMTPESLSSLMYGEDEDPEDTVYEILSQLTSILHFTKGQSLRLLHESLRDCLTDRSRCQNPRFYIDMPAAHHFMTKACVRIIKHLSRDICQVSAVGTHIQDVRKDTVDRFLPSVLKYACRYWLQHALCCDLTTHTMTEIQDVLYDQALYWIEALAWLKDLPAAVQGLKDLASTLLEHKARNTSEQLSISLHAWVVDLIQFVTTHNPIISEYPLQIYCSALHFAPSNSKVAKHFQDQKPRYLVNSLMDDFREPDWDDSLINFQMPNFTSDVVLNSSSNIAAFFSHRSVKIVSLASGKTLRTVSSVEVCNCQDFERMDLSLDGSMMAISLSDGAVVILDTFTGNVILQTPSDLHEVVFMQFVLSDEYLLLVQCSGRVVRIKIQGSALVVDVVQEETDSSGFNDPSTEITLGGHFIAMKSSATKITIWNVESLSIMEEIEFDNRDPLILKFSADGLMLLLADGGSCLRLWSRREKRIRDLPWEDLPCRHGVDTNDELGDVWYDSLQISPSGAWICYTNKSRNLVVRSLTDTSYEVAELGPVRSARFTSQEDALIVLIAGETRLGILFLENESLYTSQPFRPSRLSWSVDTKLVAMRSMKQCRVWEILSLMSSSIDTAGAVSVFEQWLTPKSTLVTAQKVEDLRIQPYSKLLNGFTQPGVVHIGGTIMRLSPSVTGNLVAVLYHYPKSGLVMVDIDTQMILATLEQMHVDATFFLPTCIFSSEDNFVYSWQDRIVIWHRADLSTKTLVMPCSCWQSPIAFSPDGQLVAIWHDTNLQIWNPATGAARSINVPLLAQDLEHSRLSGFNLRFAPNGEHIVLSGQSTVCKIINLKSNASEIVTDMADSMVEKIRAAQDSTVPFDSTDWWLDAWFDSESKNLWLCKHHHQPRITLWSYASKQCLVDYKETELSDYPHKSPYDEYDFQTDSFSFIVEGKSHEYELEVDAMGVSPAISEHKTSSVLNQSVITVSQEGDWVLVHGKKCIHLPYNRRPVMIDKSDVSQTGTLMTIQSYNGLFTVLRLDPKDQPWLIERV